MKAEMVKPALELYFILVGAPDDQSLSSREYQEDLRTVDRSLRSQGVEVSTRCYVHDSIGGGGGLSGEFGVIASALGPALCTAVGTALGAFLNGRYGRKVRLRTGLDGKIAVEAQTVEEIKELVKVAAQWKRKSSI